MLQGATIAAYAIAGVVVLVQAQTLSELFTYWIANLGVKSCDYLGF
jgi:hypothetical protein